MARILLCKHACIRHWRVLLLADKKEEEGNFARVQAPLLAYPYTAISEPGA